jgi:hypothetical protein
MRALGICGATSQAVRSINRAGGAKEFPLLVQSCDGDLRFAELLRLRPGLRAIE